MSASENTTPLKAFLHDPQSISILSMSTDVLLAFQEVLDSDTDVMALFENEIAFNLVLNHKNALNALLNHKNALDALLNHKKALHALLDYAEAAYQFIIHQSAAQNLINNTSAVEEICHPDNIKHLWSILAKIHTTPKESREIIEKFLGKHSINKSYTYHAFRIAGVSLAVTGTMHLLLLHASIQHSVFHMMKTMSSASNDLILSAAVFTAFAILCAGVLKSYHRLSKKQQIYGKCQRLLTNPPSPAPQ